MDGMRNTVRAIEVRRVAMSAVEMTVVDFYEDGVMVHRVPFLYRPDAVSYAKSMADWTLPIRCRAEFIGAA